MTKIKMQPFFCAVTEVLFWALPRVGLSKHYYGSLLRGIVSTSRAETVYVLACQH
jgi:hypothetical protein